VNDIIDRLERIEARIAISELRSRYCWHTTRGDRDEVLALFTEDCIFENNRSAGEKPLVITGRAALRGYLSRMAPGRRVPMVTNEVLTVTGDAAIGTCVMQSIGADPFCGHYVDEFRKVAGQWQFSARRFYPYWPIFRPSADYDGP
jgi:hypothetical protein